MSYLAVIDESACLAHGDCADVAPDVFVIEDVARVLGPGPEETVLAAAESCPASAISILDESGQTVYP